MPPAISPFAVPAANAESAPLPPDLPFGYYAQLKQRVRGAGLLEPQPLYYTLKIALTACLAVPGLILLLSTRNPWLQSFDALYLAFVFAQVSFLGHDVGHRQIRRAGRACTVLELVFGNLLVGVSSTWWMTKHNQHHSHPNHTDRDPDVRLPVIAFSAGRARAMNRLQRLIVGYQHLLFVPLTMLEGAVLRISSVQFLVTQRGRRWRLELLLIALHLAAYGWLVFHQLGLAPGMLFIAVHQMTFGLYMGLVFAPNHKGMLVIEGDENADFLLEQVLTSRNVNPSPVIDFMFGGLNFQIEHHLFPSMPRNRLREAKVVVESFCLDHSIPYCQTSLIDSYRDIVRHLYTVGSAARGVGSTGS